MKRSKTIRRIVILIIIWTIPLIALLLPEETYPDEGQVSYTLAWNRGDAELTDGAWQWTTNLGYEVELTTAYLVAYEAQLTACEHSHGWFDWATLGVSTVSAGHGDDSNASTWSRSQVENLIDLPTQAWGTVTVYEPTYCEAFFLIARGATDTINLPNEVDMYATSLYLEGRYTMPNSTDTIPFVLQTGHANGVLDEFSQNGDAVHIALSDEVLEVAITRSLDTLLDDIEFDSMDSDDAAFQVLRNIVNNTTFEVLSGKTHTN